MKPLPSMTPRIAIMPLRSDKAMCRGTPATARTVVANMAPIIQARGRPARTASRPPRPPIRRVRAIDRSFGPKGQREQREPTVGLERPAIRVARRAVLSSAAVE
ncbi:MAG: hypothetical protein Kilf2KO_10380 [Rhodospirillales bacterium]